VASDELTTARRLRQRGDSECDIQEIERDPTEEQVLAVLPGLADLIIDNNGERSLNDVCGDIRHWSQNGEAKEENW
jgi:hypothetical protein